MRASLSTAAESADEPETTEQRRGGMPWWGWVVAVAGVAALVLGIIGFVLTPIPLSIGLTLGGTLDVLAVVFGIVRANKAGVGKGTAVAGLVLGGLALLSTFAGAGTVW